MFKHWRKALLGVGVAGIVLAVFTSGSAVGASTVVPGDNTVTSGKIKNGEVWGQDVHALTIGQDKLGWDFQQRVANIEKTANEAKTRTMTPGPKGDDGEDSTVPGPAGANGKSYGCDGNLVDAEHPAAKCEGDKGAPGDPATDVKGAVVLEKDFDPTTVVNIGGTFSTKATLVGKVTLPAGKLKVDLDGFWTTLAAGPAGTRPQLALRGTGVAVTIFPGEASPAKDRELTGHATRVVTLAADTEVSVYAFGYNDDTSSNGGGRLQVTASVVATRG